MQPHELRVIAEKRELDEKLAKLSAFISARSPVFIGLDPMDKSLLRDQRDAMSAYSDTLADRIARFGKPEVASIRYVCGFLFDPKGEMVLLIRKNRPTWMEGLWNGIGGKIEPGETPEQAMDREFEEETGISALKWEHVATISGVNFEVTLFAARSEKIEDARQMTDEEIHTIYVANLAFHQLVANLPVLVALALDNSGIKKPVYLTDTSPPAGA